MTRIEMRRGFGADPAGSLPARIFERFGAQEPAAACGTGYRELPEVRAGGERNEGRHGRGRASALRSDLLEACRRTHAELLDDLGVRPSPLFVDPHRFIPHSTAVPQPPASAPAITCLTGADVPAARHFTRAEVRRAGLPDDVVDDVVLAVSELVSNALTHGRPPARLSVYTERESGQAPVLVCHVRDDGGVAVDALAGYAPPTDLGTSGRGLWMARQLCDSVEVSTAGGPTHVRVLSLLPTA
jgi:anti-sigma regulatory factor (Ser/Thr protein kinase)